MRTLMTLVFLELLGLKVRIAVQYIESVDQVLDQTLQSGAQIVGSAPPLNLPDRDTLGRKFVSKGESPTDGCRLMASGYMRARSIR